MMKPLVEFVIIKVGQRDYADPAFGYNWKAAGEELIPRGAYWFLDDERDGKFQAEFFWNLIKHDQTKTNAGQGLGIAILIIGIVAIIMAVIPCIGLIAIVPGIVALVFSIIALNQASNGNGAKGLIIAALVISILATSVAILWGFVFSKTISNKSWWKAKIEKAIETEGNLDDYAVKQFGDDLEKVLEELEADADSGAINKMESGKPMTDEEFDKFLINYEKLIVELINLQIKT